MRQRRPSMVIGLLCLATGMLAQAASAQPGADLIPSEQIAELRAEYSAAAQNTTPIRAKLAYRRVVREAQALIDKHPAAPNRYELLGVMFQCQKGLIELENTTENRRAFVETCRQMATAPNEYAEIRLDADLVLSQVDQAQNGGGTGEKAEALRVLVRRYRGTPVEGKVIRIAMAMSVEWGEVSLTEYLSDTIVERYSNDLEMIAFLRQALPSSVLGTPFVATLLDSKGRIVRFPMDYVGRTTALFFWSMEGDGEEHIKTLAELTKDRPQEARDRITLISVNLDGLPDAGQSILKKHGMDWPALSLPGGTESLAYQAYVRKHPRTVTLSPTGTAALFIYGGNMHGKGYERWLRSSHGRTWTFPYYRNCVMPVFIGDFLVLDAQGAFDPALPPELKALSKKGEGKKLKATSQSVPAETLQAIQACFIQPPHVFEVELGQLKAGYQKAEGLCRKAIAAHPDAPNLWIVRNRRIVALMGLWRIQLDHNYLKQAADEARAALEAGYPQGTDTIARFCLAREALHAADADHRAIIGELVQSSGNSHGPSLAVATLLAVEAGDRTLHERYRKSLLEQHVDNPALWSITAYLLDRYHRYWLFTEPFTSGRTFDFRENNALGSDQPDDVSRTLRAEYQTVDGKKIRIPEDTRGKWTIITFCTPDNLKALPTGADPFAERRPFKDVTQFGAVLGGDAKEVQAHLSKDKNPPAYPTLLIPGGMDNPIARQFGFQKGVNTIIIRPDGKVATVLGGLAVENVKRRFIPYGNVVQWHDEAAVDEALAKGDLKEAKRLAFTYAPVEQKPGPDADPNAKPQPISLVHQRARAKVYMAMGEWQLALADAESIYEVYKRQASGLSMKTKALEQAEDMLTEIRRALRQSKPTESPL